jgi:arylsulfatase A-like enzyme
MHGPYVPAQKAHDARYLADLERYMATCYVVACDASNPENARLIDVMRSAYLATLDDLDVLVARVLRLAKSRGRPFVIVAMADHGELFGEHGGYAHGGGFVPELLKIPFVVFDSRSIAGRERCELMTSGDALRSTVAAAVGRSAPYSDHEHIEIVAPTLGSARIDRRAATIEFRLNAESRAHAGTWRNIHMHGDGTAPFPIATCK